jgi:fucose 4-O-acetylase-like acetyltransferase
MQQRIEELDYLKGIFIILMITFHLVYIGDSYPYAKRIVHTFHMPGFLIISGYLMNISKPWRDFIKTMLGYAIPYCIMESGYIVMASELPIREHIDVFTFGVFVDMLLLNPIGPYWYLHTLICCRIVYAVVTHFVHIKANSQIILLGIVFHVLSNVFCVMSFACSLYFLAGVILRRSGIPFTNVFQPSAIAILAFVLLAIHPQNLLMEQSGGVLMVYLAIVGFIFSYSYIGQKNSSLLLFLGRNTMPLFLFSPIFTFLCKCLVPVLQFEPTRLLFLLLSLIICITGSLSIESVMNRTGMSQYFYYK